jgi:hypothetical protein
MKIEDFIYEETTEGDFNYDFYTVYSQCPCDDPYYPPYTNDIGIYKSKNNAIKRARDTFYRMAQYYTEPEDRKYGGVEGMFYVEGCYFNDADDEVKRNICAKSDKPLYIIYDKEEQEKSDTRYKKMHEIFKFDSTPLETKDNVLNIEYDKKQGSEMF